MLVPYLTGDWSSETFTGAIAGDGEWGGWKLAIVWLYVMLWTSLGVEACATFTPEYRRGSRDAAIALRAAALFSLAVFVLFPLGAAGAAGEQAVASEPLTFYLDATDRVLGGGSDVMVVLIVGSLVLVINTCFADSARALFGIAADGMTLRQLDRLNRFGVPGRALTVDLLVNLGLLFLVGNTLAIIATGNLGYLAAHVFALAAFVLLRRRWSALVAVAAVLSIGLAIVLVVGATSFRLTGYGGGRELATALAILGGSLALYAFRRVVQDGLPLRLRDPN
jgi:amino acid transporter